MGKQRIVSWHAHPALVQGYVITRAGRAAWHYEAVGLGRDHVARYVR